MRQATSRMIPHYGLMVDPTPTGCGTTVFAEVVPASSLVRWAGFGRTGWRACWPLATGRSWRQPHIRWWYEIHEQLSDGMGVHHYRSDGGGITLRQTMRKAGDAVQNVIRLTAPDVHQR